MAKKSGVEISSEMGVGIVSFMATSISNSEGIAEASEEIVAYIGEKKPTSLVIDFSKVKFFSSRVLGLLLELLLIRDVSPKIK